MTNLGAVAIGRNEGERLRLCLGSLVGRCEAVVYVDSGSTDESVALARSLGVEVVELDMSSPFTAARARNAGFRRLTQLHPDLVSVQFVDGDCEIVAGWLDRATSELEAPPEVAVVCGRVRERHPERSVYNRLADIEWDTPIGDAQACGGIFAIRAGAFAGMGGFDPSLVAGEEPELCHRLRGAGWLIRRVDAEMALHDLGMTRFGEWWRRQVRFGYAELDVAALHRGGPFVEQTRRALLWTVGWSLALAAALGAAVALRGPIPILVAALVACAPMAQAARAAFKVRRRVPDWRTAAAHGALTAIGKWAEARGHVRYLWDRASGRKARPIEARPSATDALAPARPPRGSGARGSPIGPGLGQAP